MFSLARKLTKNDIEFLPIEISSTKVSANNAGISTSKITSEKNTWKQCGFFDHQNYVKKLRGNKAEIPRILVFDVLM